MFARLAVLFVAVPFIELYLLLELTNYTGSAVATFGLVIFTGILGAWLAKQQGLSTLRRIQQATAEGRMPGKELVDGGMILVAGALLLTPGILTDAFGFSLLMPPCRAVYRKLLKRAFPTTGASGVQFHATGFSFGGSTTTNGFNGMDDEIADDPNVVDGTVQHPTDDE